MVYRYDRFARSLHQLVNALEDFRALGIDFVSLHEGVDTSTPNGRLVFGIFASIAEFERELIRDRVRSGLAAAKAKGKRLGRPHVVVDAARVAALRAQGRSWREITAETGLTVKGRLSVRFLACPKTYESWSKPLLLLGPARSVNYVRKGGLLGSREIRIVLSRIRSDARRVMRTVLNDETR